MKEARKQELYNKLKELSSMANEICCELHEIADLYYEQGDTYNYITHMALDADELSMKLACKVLLEETFSCKIEGEYKEIAVGDEVGFVKPDGQVGVGVITNIIPGSEPFDLKVEIANERTKEFEGSYHVGDLITWSSYYYLERERWNWLVKSLKDEGKKVTLLRIAVGFHLSVFNDNTGAVYSKNNLHLKDFDDNLFNEMRNV